jgi:streptogramin lyase/PKD repeat protein
LLVAAVVGLSLSIVVTPAFAYLGEVSVISAGITDNSEPWGITSGPEGDMWFTQTHSDRIARVTATGEVTEFSTGITPESGPLGIVSGPEGDLWFAQSSGHIGRITPAGDVTEFSTGITPESGSDGIVVGAEGDLWFTQFRSDQIGRITPSGEVTEFSTAITPESEPRGIALGAEGDLWFTQFRSDQIGRITPTGEVTEFSAGIDPSSYPEAIATGHEGDLWFTQGSGEVARITPAGEVTEMLAAPTFYQPSGIAVGSEGDLWFTTNDEFYGGAIERITPQGEVADFPLPADGGPREIAAGSEGDFWFTLDSANEHYPGSYPSRIGRIVGTGSGLAPTVTLQPVEDSVTAPAQAAFSANCEGRPLPTLQWEVSTDGSSFSAIPGETGGDLVISPTSLEENGNQYRVTCKNIAGSKTSEAATLRTDLPAVGAVSPANGPTTGATEVTITGEDLGEVESVRFGAIPATAVKAVSAATVTATAPAHVAGRVDVTLTSSAGTSKIGAADQFTYEGPVPVNTSPPRITGTPRVGQTLAEGHGQWTNSPTSYEYQWLQCENAGTECDPIPGATGQTYEPTSPQVGETIEVLETAVNSAGASSSSASSMSPPVTALPLVANAGEVISSVVGAPATLDGSGSTPAEEITGYEWTFGDGTSAQGAIVDHVYESPGTYTATLTITASGGRESTATTIVLVSEAPSASGSGASAGSPSVTVLDSEGTPLAGAEVLYVDPSGTKTSATTDDDGVAQLPDLPEGEDTVYAYAQSYQPSSGAILVTGGAGEATITLQSGSVATTTLESKELTLAEIEAAGIDTSKPENQVVDGFTAELDLVSQASGSGGSGANEPVGLTCDINSSAQFLGKCGGKGLGGAWSCSPGGCQSPDASVSGADVGGHPVLQWLILHGSATTLKQFYDVTMVVTNLSPEPFELANGRATLNLPSGMSLAPTTSAQTLTQTVATIPGSSSAQAEWAIRGDEPGSYNLSASYEGTLEPFGLPVSLDAGVAQPLKVWGLNALSLSVQADSSASASGEPGKPCKASAEAPCFYGPYHVRLGLTNNADVPIYDAALAVDPKTHKGFIFQPDERFSDQVAEVRPGETVYSHTYILVPDASGAAKFDPSQASMTFAGQTPAPGQAITSLAAPPVYSLKAPNDTPRFVHLQWEPVPEATAYELFGTSSIDTPFSSEELMAATSPGAQGVEELPASATDAYVPQADGPVFAVSALVKGQPTLEYPVVEAAAGSASPPASSPSVSVKSTVVGEPTAAPSLASVVVTLSAPSASQVSVDYKTQDGTGAGAATVAHGDYTPAQGTVTFAPGETKQTIAVRIDPSGLTSTASFGLTLSNPINASIGTGSATVQIVGGCVVPDPNGSALPAGTPSPIPGAITFGNLEAVGCFKAQSDGSYTTSKPTRVDGIDVDPAAGTTITVHPDAIVTSDGPATVGVGKLFMLPVKPVKLDFSAPTIAEGLGESPTLSVGPRIAGVPFSLSSGGWQATVGQTTLGLELQLPTTLNATRWSSGEGVFKDGSQTVPSIGGKVNLLTTNREGFTSPTLCAQFTGGEFKLWNLNVNTSWIKQASACYQQQAEAGEKFATWTLTGKFQLPEAWRVAKAQEGEAKEPIEITGSVSIRSDGEGLRWTKGSIQLENLSVPLAYDLILERFGASFERDFTNVPPTTSNFGVNAGLSFGPPLPNGKYLLSLDGKGQIGPWATPAYWKLSGSLLLLRGSPFQVQLASGYLNIFGNGTVELGGALGLQLPYVHWGLQGQMSGFWDQERKALQLAGSLALKLPLLGETKAQGLINNTGVVFCLSQDHNYAVGGVLTWENDALSLFSQGTCDIGNYTISAPATGASATGASAAPRLGGRAGSAAAQAGAFQLRLPAHLAGTTIAVRGRGGAPRVAVHGPDLSLDTPPGEAGVMNRRVLLVQDPSVDTTYVTLYEPHGGIFAVSALPGSAPIASVRAALPAPRATVSVRVSAGQCLRQVRYTARVPSGERLALYAENGTVRTFLGYARGRGARAFAPDVAVSGSGRIRALELRGSLPRRLSTIATFGNVAVTRTAPVSGLHLHGRTLSWEPVCGAVSYSVLIRRDRTSTSLSSASSRIALPKVSGKFTVTVVGVTARGTRGAKRTKTYGRSR